LYASELIISEQNAYAFAQAMRVKGKVGLFTVAKTWRGPRFDRSSLPARLHCFISDSQVQATSEDEGLGNADSACDYRIRFRTD